MTTRRRSSSSSPRRSSARRGSASTRSSRSTRSSTAPATGTRRRQSRPATTLGAAVGTVVVAFLLGAPWSVRVALIVVVVVGAAGYLVWARRR